jgi:hypothetical protein
MNFRKQLLLLVLIFIVGQKTASASHMMGANMQFRNLGNDSFYMTMYVYRDCNGIDFQGPQIGVTPSDSSTYWILGTIASHLDVTPICGGITTRCKNYMSTFEYGVERFMINALCYLPRGKGCKYEITFEQCCRNGAITTGAAGQDFYLRSVIDVCNLRGNTPSFNYDPIILTCKNVCTDRYQSALANAGDSLVYALAPPFANSTYPIPYNTGYSDTIPFAIKGKAADSVCGGFFFDKHTGEIRFRPIKEDITVYSVQVSQYQKINGKYVFVSQIEQDIETLVLLCAPNVKTGLMNRPPIIQPQDQITDDIQSYPGEKLDLKYTISDADKDSVQIKFAGPGKGNITLAKGSPKILSFNWRPSKTDARPDPYRLMITTSDTAYCPVPSIVQREIRIHVNDSSKVKLTKKIINCQTCYSASFTDKGAYNAAWYVNDTFRQTGSTYCFTGKHGRYFIKGIIKRPEGTYFIYDTLQLNANIVSSRKSDSVCSGDSITLRAIGGNRYKWQPSSTLQSIGNGEAIATPLKNTWYFVNITDTLINCTTTDSIYIAVDTTCVWPGDANRDKVVDGKDLLQVGLLYGKAGYARDSTSNDFHPQPVKDWGLRLKGVDYKYADCNGDGVINDDDTLAIYLNSSRTHLVSPPSSHKNDIPVKFVFDKKVYVAGDAAAVKVSLEGYAAEVYGLYVNYSITGNMIAEILPFNHQCAFLCGNGRTLMMSKEVSPISSWSAIVRTDRTGVNGDGDIAQFHYILKHNSDYPYTNEGSLLKIKINEIVLIDNNGNIISTTLIEDSALVKRNTSIQNQLSEKDISIYPNPAQDELNINTSIEHGSVSVLNTLGETLQRQALSQGTMTMKTGNLPAGLYFVRIETKDGSLVRKVIIQR